MFIVQRKQILSFSKTSVHKMSSRRLLKYTDAKKGLQFDM